MICGMISLIKFSGLVIVIVFLVSFMISSFEIRCYSSGFCFSFCVVFVLRFSVVNWLCIVMVVISVVVS